MRQLVLFLMPAVWGAFAVTGGIAQQPKIDFAHDVVPILKERCSECHAGEESKGGFSINTRALILDAEAATPGKAGESRLIELITSSDPEDQMPPKDRPRLAGEEISVLRRWINEGLAWQESFTFARQQYEPALKPRRPELPPAVDGRDNPVDRILDAYLAKRELPRGQRLSDAAFLRRLYLDILGLLPDTERLAAFLAEQRQDKRARLVAEVLNNQQTSTK